jgi:preprotein translocase subunit SecE
MAVDVAKPQGSARGGPPAAVPAGNWWTRLVAFYRGVMAEMKKVTWPDFPQVRSATVAIIIFVLILGLFITLMDTALQAILVKLLPSLFAR